jgi:hypothetical protein
MTDVPDEPQPGPQAESQPEQPEQPSRPASADLRPQLPRTGDQQVDEALEPLGDVHDLPPSEQVEVYVGVHRALQDRLADLEG